jgi:hypothetical protein
MYLISFPSFRSGRTEERGQQMEKQEGMSNVLLEHLLNNPQEQCMPAER